MDTAISCLPRNRSREPDQWFTLTCSRSFARSVATTCVVARSLALSRRLLCLFVDAKCPAVFRGFLVSCDGFHTLGVCGCPFGGQFARVVGRCVFRGGTLEGFEWWR